jgi:4-oxalocrotonate tautomerase
VARKRSLEQKRALVKEITEVVVRNFSVPAEAVVVEIIEADPTSKAKRRCPVQRARMIAPVGLTR